MRTIEFGAAANKDSVSEHTLRVVDQIMAGAGVDSLTISSSQRTAEAQARAMFANAANLGVLHQLNLYGDAGDQVLLVIWKFVTKGVSRAEEKAEMLARSSQIQAAMVAKIREVGAEKVSRHCVADTSKLNVIDIAPSSIRPRDKVSRFYAAACAHPAVAKALGPSQGDPAIHLEILQAQTTDSAAPTARVSASSLNLRREPSTASPVIRAIARDTEVTILEEWAEVRLASGETGFVASRYLAREAQ